MAESSDAEKSGAKAAKSKPSRAKASESKASESKASESKASQSASSEEAAPAKKLTPLEAVKQRQAALAQSRASGTKRGSTATDAATPGAASSHRPAVQLQRKAGDS